MKYEEVKISDEVLSRLELGKQYSVEAFGIRVWMCLHKANDIYYFMDESDRIDIKHISTIIVPISDTPPLDVEGIREKFENEIDTFMFSSKEMKNMIFDFFSPYLKEAEVPSQQIEGELPKHYKEVSEPSWMGKGNHSVKQLEEICEGYLEYTHQLKVKNQSLSPLSVNVSDEEIEKKIVEYEDTSMTRKEYISKLRTLFSSSDSSKEEAVKFAEWVLNKGYRHVILHNTSIHRTELGAKKITGEALYELFKQEMK